MISGNTIKRVIGSLCLVLLGFVFFSCGEAIPGDWPKMKFTSKVFLVGPEGGHFEATVLNYETINIDYIIDGISQERVRWNNGSYMNMDELTVSHVEKGNKIEIDVAPSDNLNEWWIGVSNLDIFDTIHVIQNGM